MFEKGKGYENLASEATSQNRKERNLMHYEHIEPNMETHPEFGIALLEAQESGVHILACDCLVTENSMTIEEPVPVRLHTIE